MRRLAGPVARYRACDADEKTHAVMLEEIYAFIEMPEPAFGLQLILCSPCHGKIFFHSSRIYFDALVERP